MAVCFLSRRGDSCGPLWWWTAAGCHSNKRPPQPRQRSIAPSLCLPGNWLRQQRCLSLLGSWAAFEPLMGDQNVLTLPDVIGGYRMRVFIFSLKEYHGILKYISALMCKNIPGVVCFFRLAGMLPSHLFPCQSTSTTLDFLSWINQILYLLLSSSFASYISVLHEPV